MKLSILVPFRDADGTRTRAKEWILARWAHFWPEAEIITAADDGVDPFNKSMAVNNAAKQASGDIYIILDADTWIDPKWMQSAFRAMETSRYKWAIPARRSFRLTRSRSDYLLSLDPTAELPPLVNRREIVEQYGGVVGFIHIVPREGFEAVGGMDERFRGWGGEDSCFVRAIDVVYGAHVQLPGQVMSLWHERPRSGYGRYWLGETQEHVTRRSELGKAYREARTKPAMLRLLGMAA